MEICESKHSDLPEIIALLKISLGEKLIPKSEEFFLWKHEKNPFGKSKTLLAKEGDRIIGLRTFMYWKWKSENDVIAGVRAVDTATDPAFQGKGIFRKLTMTAVEKCKEEGVSLVFNTPNPVSMQGYLKMGWEVAGRLPLFIGRGSLLPRKWNKETDDDLKTFCPVDINEINASTSEFFHTPLSREYINWRYRDCPLVNYGSMNDDDWGFIFRLKPFIGFMEMRICEAWSSKASEKYLQQAIRKCIARYKPALVTCGSSPLLPNEIPLKRFFGPFKKGPVTTVRSLAMTGLSDFIEFKKWRPSIGSLELF